MRGFSSNYSPVCPATVSKNVPSSVQILRRFVLPLEPPRPVAQYGCLRRPATSPAAQPEKRVMLKSLRGFSSNYSPVCPATVSKNVPSSVQILRRFVLPLEPPRPVAQYGCLRRPATSPAAQPEKRVMLISNRWRGRCGEDRSTST